MAFPHCWFTYNGQSSMPQFLKTSRTHLHYSYLNTLLLITPDPLNWKRSKKVRVQSVGGCSRAVLSWHILPWRRIYCHTCLRVPSKVVVPVVWPWAGGDGCSMSHCSSDPSTSATMSTLSCHHTTFVLGGKPWKPVLLFLVVQWKWMLKCQKCPWAENHRSWLCGREVGLWLSMRQVPVSRTDTHT